MNLARQILFHPLPLPAVPLELLLEFGLLLLGALLDGITESSPDTPPDCPTRCTWE